jgi:mono/diheme cytochrome c family protein
MKTIKITTACIIILGLVAALARAEEAKALWDKNCAACHGKDGKGNTTMGRKSGVRDYTDPKVQKSLDDTNAFKAVKLGLTKDGKERMKPFADKLTDDEIKALVTNIKTFKRAE